MSSTRTPDHERFRIISHYLHNPSDGGFGDLIRKILQTPEAQELIYQHRFLFASNNEEDEGEQHASLAEVTHSGVPIDNSGGDMEVDLRTVVGQDYDRVPRHRRSQENGGVAPPAVGLEGNLSEGFRVHGPYLNFEHAAESGVSRDLDFWIVSLIQPDPADFTDFVPTEGV